MNMMINFLNQPPEPPAPKKKVVQPAQVNFVKPQVYAAAARQAVTPQPPPPRQQPAPATRNQQQIRRMRENEQSQREENARRSEDEAGVDVNYVIAFDSQSGSQQQQGEQESGEDSDLCGLSGSAANAAQLEAQELSAILPNGSCNGIFDVTMPNGESLGVAVDSDAKRTTYMLTSDSEKTKAKLFKIQKELNDCLERRIGRDVQLNIL